MSFWPTLVAEAAVTWQQKFAGTSHEKKEVSHQILLRLLTKDSRSGRNYKSESIRYSASPAPAVIKFMHNINLSLLMYITWFKFPLLPLTA